MEAKQSIVQYGKGALQLSDSRWLKGIKEDKAGQQQEQ